MASYTKHLASDSKDSPENDNSKDVNPKRLKLDNHKEESAPSFHPISSFKDFKLTRILSENSALKSLSLEGTFGAFTNSSVVLLNKLPVSKVSVDEFVNTSDFALNLKTKTTKEPNLTEFACYPDSDKSDIKATIIHPATSKHIEKYTRYPQVKIAEYELTYVESVKKFLESKAFSLDWVYNILEHKSEVDRILFEDPDEELGFVLLPDLTADKNEKGSIYLIAICRKRNIRSLRDLRAEHLPLLRNIRDKSLDVIYNLYKIPPEKLRVYFHYQPSYYHLHIHFASIDTQMYGNNFERARLLDTVINNIEFYPQYYEKCTLTYMLQENDHLWSKLKKILME